MAADTPTHYGATHANEPAHDSNDEPGESSWRRLWRSWPSLSLSRQARKLWWHQILPFLLAILFVSWTYWFNSVMQVMCQRRENVQEAYMNDPLLRNIYNRPDKAPKHVHVHKGQGDEEADAPLPEQQPQSDLGYRLLPDLEHLWIVCDAMALGLVILLLLKFTCFTSCKARVVLKRYFLIQGAHSAR